MSQFAALLRKHWIESRWLLGFACAAFCSFGVLISWLAKSYEKILESGDMQLIGSWGGPFRRLGGANMDGSTTALEIAFWNHPFIVLTVLSWAISRGSMAVAGEIERGTIDVNLATHLPFEILALANHIFHARLCALDRLPDPGDSRREFLVVPTHASEPTYVI